MKDSTDLSDSQGLCARTLIKLKRHIKSLSEWRRRGARVEDSESTSIVPFESITRRMLDPTKDSAVVCPLCGNRVDFRQRPEWYGPTAFMCPHCKSLVHMHQLHL